MKAVVIPRKSNARFFNASHFIQVDKGESVNIEQLVEYARENGAAVLAGGREWFAVQLPSDGEYRGRSRADLEANLT